MAPRRRVATRSSSSRSGSEASGNSLDRRTTTYRKRLAKPFDISVSVKFRRSSSIVLCHGTEVLAIPGVAQDPAQRIAFTLHHPKDGAVFRLHQEQALILDPRIDAAPDQAASVRIVPISFFLIGRIAHRMDQAFAGRQRAATFPARPHRVGLTEEGPNPSTAGAFA